MDQDQIRAWVAHARRVAAIYERHDMPDKATQWLLQADAIELELVSQ